MSTIITRNSATSGSSPSSLVQGELAINVTDNRLYFGSGSANTVKEFGVTSSYALQALSASYAVSASHEIIKEISSSYADTASFAQSGDGIFSGSFSGSYEGDGSNLTGVDAFPYVGDAIITGSLIISGSNTSLISLPDAPNDSIIISGSNNRTRLHIYDSEENNTPTYTEGAGVKLTGGDGAGQATLEIAAVGSNNGGSNNEQTFIHSNQMLTLRGNDNDAGANIKFRGSFGGINFNSSTTGTSLVYFTNGGATRSTIALGTTSGNATDGVALSARSSGTDFTIVAGGNTWLDMSSTKATFIADVSSSAASTASFGHYIGDGSEITGVISSSYAVTASFALNGGGGSVDTGSLLTTASVSLNTITFTKGDGSTFPITVDTGSGGGGAGFPFTGDAVITGSLVVSASATSQSLSVQGSGSTVFDVIGSVGTLFSIDDDLNGMLFTANDISGFPVLQASASGDVFIGKSPQSLYTTTVISSTTAATTHSLCTLSTSSYDGAFFEYTAQSASNARAGNIMSTWNGTDIVYTETTTADIGRTTDLTTEVIISGSTARLVAYGPNAGYKIKTIIKAI